MRWRSMDTIARRSRFKREGQMADRLALAPSVELPSPETISKVLLGGDLAQLTPPHQISYYRSVCDSLGLNPLTKPFEFLRLSGRLVLYATRNCTDQLRKRYAISVTITAREVVEDTYVVTARATMPDGRHDESIGAVPIAGLKGESRSNALMKAETKAKRRVTLSLVGLSTLDESEIDSIPNAQPVPFDPAPLAKSLTPSPGPVLDGAPNGGAEVGAAAVPANHTEIPETWRPFIKTEPSTVITGRITAGRRSKCTGKTTITVNGQEFFTLSLALGSEAIAFKEANEPVTITSRPTTDGEEFVSIAVANDAAF